ncbi:MAG: N-acetylmuramoyl-L-alanine amidase [Clostridia bacterium]|nr:N-acetylmuramoyl-L-alanine amidase [Clostridia bacterium]
MKIILDPGHGRYGNPYPPQKGFYEGTQMWVLANYLKEELEKYGFDVVSTRPDINDMPSLYARGALAKGASLLLSLHSNAPQSALDTKPTGSVVYYSLEDESNKVLADMIGNKVSEVMSHYYRGSMIKVSPKGDDYNGVIRSAVKNGCTRALLVEHGFHTNLKDSEFLISNSKLQKLAAAEAGIIAEYFGFNRNKEGEAMFRTLRYGMAGEDVEFVQKFLALHGYYTGPIDSSFGPGQGFLNAVKSFQKAEGLTADGVIDSASRAKIFEIILTGSITDSAQMEELMSKVSKMEIELKKYVEYFRLQTELRMGIEMQIQE